VTSTIASAALRRRTTLRGEVVNVVAYERPWVRSDVTVSDGTGNLVLRFMGRRHIPGMVPGRRVRADGTPGLVRGNLVMVDPLYSFDDAGCGSGIN